VLQLFKRKSSNLIGVDISSTSVKLLELSQVTNGYRVDSFAVEPLPANAVVEKEIRNAEQVGVAISRAVSRANPHTLFAATAMSGSSVITKIIQMSADLTDSELESQIDLEADRYIPYKLDEVSLDFEVIGPSASAPNMVDVLLAASRTENVDTRIEALELGGLTAKVVDVESYAIERAYQLLIEELPDREPTLQSQNNIVGLVDIGATVMTFNVFQNNDIIYTRDQVFGGRQLFDAFQRRYGMSNADTLEAIYSGKLPEGCEEEILTPFREGIVQQVNRSLQFFFSSSNFESIQHIMLAGGVAGLPDISNYLGDHIGMSVSVADPFLHMDVSRKIPRQALQRWAPAMMIGCGLALRSFD
jgi:type IV pilus assembly protein PilM